MKIADTLKYNQYFYSIYFKQDTFVHQKSIYESFGLHSIKVSPISVQTLSHTQYIQQRYFFRPQCLSNAIKIHPNPLPQICGHACCLYCLFVCECTCVRARACVHVTYLSQSFTLLQELVQQPADIRAGEGNNRKRSVFKSLLT